MPHTNRKNVEMYRFSMAELYELRGVIVRHSRTLPPGRDRNEHRQIATSIRLLFKNRKWLALHTVGGLDLI